jgi:hypothetical protein
MKSCQVARLLPYVPGLVNQELLLQVEYLVAEKRILRAHAPARLRFRMSNAPRWPKSARGWVGRDWRKSP